MSLCAAAPNLPSKIHRSSTTTSNLIQKLNLCSIKSRFLSLKFINWTPKNPQQTANLTNKKALHRTSKISFISACFHIPINIHNFKVPMNIADTMMIRLFTPNPKWADIRTMNLGSFFFCKKTIE